MFMLRLSLMLVVFVDIMGQGLILPIINTLLIDPSSGFLQPGTTDDTREMLYGILYLDDYMIERFHFDTLQNSIIMTVFGLTMAFSSGVLVGPLSTRFRKIPTVTYAVAIMAVGLVMFIFNGNPLLSYFYVVSVVITFAICHPKMLSLFSESAGADEQGWVMGITIALFTLGSGLISLCGGAMMAIDAALPFITGVDSFLVALIFIATLWRQADVRSLEPATIGKR